MNKQVKDFPFLSLLCLAIWVVGPRALAQTRPGLELRLHAALSITGSVGAVYSVEYVSDVAQTNDWRCLAFLQLPATNYLWFDATTPITGRRFYRAVQKQAPTNMVFIPPGTFRMGSLANEIDRIGDEGPPMAVTISRGFWMGKYEVTQGEYLAVMGANPSYFNGIRPNEVGIVNYGTDLTRPVEMVTWADAKKYCGHLTQRERAAGRITGNSVYRLPTEAEWEYACRAWTSTRLSYGDDPGYTSLTNYAWYFNNSEGATHSVGKKLANPWGLYDMHGNVFEWCEDLYGEYLGGRALDPQGPATGSFRVIRGGNWDFNATVCRSAYRGRFDPGTGRSRIGFRVVLAAD